MLLPGSEFQEGKKPRNRTKAPRWPSSPGPALVTASAGRAGLDCALLCVGRHSLRTVPYAWSPLLSLSTALLFCKNHHSCSEPVLCPEGARKGVVCGGLFCLIGPWALGQVGLPLALAAASVICPIILLAVSLHRLNITTFSQHCRDHTC